MQATMHWVSVYEKEMDEVEAEAKRSLSNAHFATFISSNHTTKVQEITAIEKRSKIKAITPLTDKGQKNE